MTWQILIAVAKRERTIRMQFKKKDSF